MSEEYKPIIIAGPCAIESEELLHNVAQELVSIGNRLNVNIIMKASFDKANRTSLASFRGLGVERGLALLAEVKSCYGLSILTDIHETWQAEPAAAVADVIQIPAFLCRQTDLIVAASRTERIVNIKKAQFLSGSDMVHPYRKAVDSGAKEVWLTERGNMYGYNNLIVDFRNITQMRGIASTVIMDCTHSVQLPGAADGCSGGCSEYVASMSLAAKAFGANGYFFEVHPEPQKALCDGANMLPLSQLENTIKNLM